MLARFIPKQWNVDLIWWMLHNSLHRRTMSNDCRFATRKIACSKSQIVRYVFTIIDYECLNMYVKIQVYPQPKPCRFEYIFADLRFAKRTLTTRICRKQPIHDFPPSTNVRLKLMERLTNVQHIYFVWKNMFASMVICFVRPFIDGSYKSALNHFVPTKQVPITGGDVAPNCTHHYIPSLVSYVMNIWTIDSDYGFHPAWSELGLKILQYMVVDSTVQLDKDIVWQSSKGISFWAY